MALDGGTGLTTAYVVTSGGAEFGMANAGQDLEVFGMSGAFTNNQPGQFSTFAVADQYTLGTSPTTLVFAADLGAACSLSPCVDAFLWTASGGFVAQTPALTSGALVPTAMAVDATTTTPPTLRVYFATGGTPATLYEQDFIPNGSGTGLTPMGVPLFRSLATGQVLGLSPDDAPYPEGYLYISDGNSNIWTVPKTYVSAGGTLTLYSDLNDGGYTDVEVISWTQPYILAGAGAGGVYALSNDGGTTTASGIVLGQASVKATSGRQTFPVSAASAGSSTTLTLVTEDAFSTFDAGPNPWLHFVEQNLFPNVDGGSSGGFDAGGIPTIPIIPPGPGQLTGTANSCNCSTAGSAPALLALLLPLLARRRRR